LEKRRQKGNGIDSVEEQGGNDEKVGSMWAGEIRACLAGSVSVVPCSLEWRKLSDEVLGSKSFGFNS
jgi:hypothetical protein